MSICLNMQSQECCPQCGREADSSRVRLVQDSCGHRKCRECLLSEETGCLSCSNLNADYIELRPALDSSQKFISDSNSIMLNSCLPLEVSSAAHEGETSPVFITADVCQEASPTSFSMNLSNFSSKESHKSEECSESSHVEGDNNSLKKRPTYGLKEHIVFTPGDPPKYFCKMCRKSCNNRKAARYHNYCGAPNSEKPHSCSVCGQGFVTKGHFEYHMKSHTGVKPFTCEACGKGFKESSKLNRHSKSHGKIEKPFKCSLCEKAYSTKQILKDHMLIHSNRLSLPCRICSKKLSSKSCLRKHEKLHGEPTHKCNDCGKKFSVKWTLEIHKKSHLRERKHKCRLCNRAFKLPSDLTRHAVVHQVDREWNCEICHLVFRRRDNLVRHLKNIHPESHLNVSNKLTKEKDIEDINTITAKRHKSPDKTSLNVVPHAVSVIRAVPVIQKAETVTNVPEPFIHINVSKPSVDELIDLDQRTSCSDYNTDQEVSVTVDEKLSKVCMSQNQNFQRESVVCHSNSRGIVHYSGLQFDCVREVFKAKQLDSSTSENHFLTSIESSLAVESEMNSSQEGLIQRPRVIVEKNLICDTL